MMQVGRLIRLPITLTESATTKSDDVHPLELNHTLNNYLLTLVLVSVLILVLIALNETTAAGTQYNLSNVSISQSNSLQSSLNSTNINLEPDDKQIVITWLEANETEADKYH